MPYYQGGCNTNDRQVSSAQTNRTQVLTLEKTLSTAPAQVDLGVCSLQGWIALETSFPKSPRSLQTEFGVKSYGFFRKVTCAVFTRAAVPHLMGGSAALVQSQRLVFES